MKNINAAAYDYVLLQDSDKFSAWAGEHFKAGVEFAQQWISVKDELPELNFNYQSDTILLKNKFGIIFSGYYDYDMASFFDYIDDEVSEIIEWRPIELK